MGRRLAKSISIYSAKENLSEIFMSVQIFLDVIFHTDMIVIFFHNRLQKNKLISLEKLSVSICGNTLVRNLNSHPFSLVLNFQRKNFSASRKSFGHGASKLICFSVRGWMNESSFACSITRGAA